jgi:ABC-type branched-subunit amino acid transport system ATPase component
VAAAHVSEPLALEKVSVTYGGVRALDEVSLEILPGSVLGLIGPNGAGKTTLINAITGIVRPSSGTIRLGGVALEHLPQHRVARAGISRTYQNIRLFGALSILENLRAGAFAQRTPLDAAAARTLLDAVALQEPNLARPAGTLPYGEQRRLEIARALAARPKIVLLDEPAAGMNPRETQALRALIRGLAERGIGVLLVEHDMPLVSAVCDSIVVLNFGRVIAAGLPSQIARDPAVIEAYLGSGAAAS